MKEYLDLRVKFYESGDRAVNEESEQRQVLLWNIFVGELKENNVNVFGLNSINKLIESQKMAVSLWANNVLALAWFIIYFLSGGACLILGYNMRVHDNLLLFLQYSK